MDNFNYFNKFMYERQVFSSVLPLVAYEILQTKRRRANGDASNEHRFDFASLCGVIIFPFFPSAGNPPACDLQGIVFYRHLRHRVTISVVATCLVMTLHVFQRHFPTVPASSPGVRDE